MNHDPQYEAARLEAEQAKLQKRMNELLAQKMAEASKRQEQQRVEAASATAVNAYIALTAQEMIEAGTSRPEVIASYIKAGDRPEWRALEVTTKLLQDPLNGFGLTSEGVRFQGKPYESVEALQKAIAAFCGHTVPNIRPLVRALLSGDDIDQVVFVRCLEYGKARPLPSNLTLNDTFRVRTLLGVDPLG